MLFEHLFDLKGADVDAAANDHVLDPAGDLQVAALVQVTEVTGVTPAAIANHRRVGLGIAPVAEHRARRPVADLSVLPGGKRLAVGVDDADLHALYRPTRARRHALVAVAGQASGEDETLGLSVDRKHLGRTQRLAYPVDQRRRNGRAATEEHPEAAD